MRYAVIAFASYYQSLELTDILDYYVTSPHSGVMGNPYRGCRYAREDARQKTASGSYWKVSFRYSSLTDGNDMILRLFMSLTNTA